jgi:hypothetical protein
MTFDIQTLTTLSIIGNVVFAFIAGWLAHEEYERIKYGHE